MDNRGWFVKLFNFDNIGTKIKNFAKYSCWVTIILEWVAAVISTIYCMITQMVGLFFTIPIAAFVASFVIWIGSWTMYAFGEFVESTAEMREDTRKLANASKNEENISNIQKIEELPEI